MRAAIVTYLDFGGEHVALAGEIAAAAATRASEVGSGRVGRASTLTLAEKAEFAARAHIRHHHTDYEDELASAERDAYGRFADDDSYLYVRANAHAAVDEFLATHRNRHGAFAEAKHSRHADLAKEVGVERPGTARPRNGGATPRGR